MESIKLTEQPSEARRRLSQSFVPGEVRRRGSLIALEHPSIRPLVDFDDDDYDYDKEPAPAPAPAPAPDAHEVSDGKEETDRPQKRISIVSRRASAMSRVFALSSISKSFQDELVSPTLVNAMIFFDDPTPDVDHLRQTLADRLLDIPRFRCIVRADEKGSVIFDPLARSDVKVKEHIVHIDGKNSFDQDDIEQMINDAYLSTWDMDMPLWRMKIITNLRDGRSLLFATIDHAIGDGVGLLSVFLSLFDDSEGNDDNETNKPKMLQKKMRKPQGLSLSHRLVATLNGIWVGIVHTLAPPPPDLPHSFMIPKEKIHDICPGKDFAQSRAFPLDEVKTMKNKLDGATVNDILMALVSMALRRYFEQNGNGEVLDKVLNGKGTMRAGFPVNMRRVNSNIKDDLGNNLVLGIFPFPIDYKDPIDCVWRAKTRVDELKLSPAFYLAKKITDTLFPIAPDTEMAGKMMEGLNRNTCMISNVLGPADASSIGGYAVDDLNFTVAYPGNLYFGVLSFGGKMRISGLLDQRTEGSLIKLMMCFEDSYDALKNALECVDENEPLRRPDMTPRSAKMLELLALILMIVLPVFVALRFAK